jgi:hypothetical protein
MKSILVMGSSRPYERVPQRAAHMVGTTLARSGFGLVAGNATGVDKAVAQAFCSELAHQNKLASEWYCQLRLPFLVRGSRWPLPGHRAPADAMVRLKTTFEWEEEAIARSDAAIMIGGRGGALRIARRFIDAGKSVFPIPFTGGRSGEIFQEILRTWCESPVPGLSRAQFLRLAEPWTGGTGSLSNLLLGALAETPDIFISYRRSDSESVVGRLHHDLSEYFGIKRVFMDLRHIAPSEKWQSSIDHALQTCKIGVVVIGRQWTDERFYDKNDVLHKEVLQLLSSGKVVVPILVENAELPKREKLPADLLTLLEPQARSINNGNWENVLTDIIRAMEDRLK